MSSFSIVQTASLLIGMCSSSRRLTLRWVRSLLYPSHSPSLSLSPHPLLAELNEEERDANGTVFDRGIVTNRLDERPLTRTISLVCEHFSRLEECSLSMGQVSHSHGVGSSLRPLSYCIAPIGQSNVDRRLNMSWRRVIASLAFIQGRKREWLSLCLPQSNRPCSLLPFLLVRSDVPPDW